MPRDAYLEWTSEWVRGRRRVLSPHGIAVPERRRQADRPVDGDGRRAGGAAASAPAEHHPLDQVDRDREGAGRQPRRPGPGPGRRPLQANQQPPLPPRLPRVRLSLHAGGTARRSIVRPSACNIRTSRTSDAGERPRPASGAAATPGSSPTTRSRAARRIGRTRRRSRPDCPRCACGCTDSSDRTVADPFLGLGSTAVACAQLGVSFVGIEMDKGYLKQAVERTRAALAASD